MSAKRHRKKKFKPNSGIKSMLFLALAALSIVLIVCIISYVSNQGIVIDDDYTFQSQISIEGVDIKGLTKKQAAEELQGTADKLTAEKTLAFSAGEQTFSYAANEIGTRADIEKTLVEAYNYEHNKDKDNDGEINLQMEFSFSKSAAVNTINKDIETINVKPKDASMKFVKEDEEGIKVDIEYIQDVSGVEVNIDALCDLLKEQAENATFQKVNAPIETIPAEITIEELKQRVSKIGSYTTKFDQDGLDKKNRVNNIVQIADAINGSEIMPGQTWSMNETAGPRTEERGYYPAPGIENGVYTDQIGGGVCQVSSTLYNAALLAELEIVESKRHSWPSAYVPYGLDATISTGGPDLVIQNNRNTPIYIIANVNRPERTCTVDIYGEKLPHNYKVQYVSKLISTQPAPEPTVRVSDVDQNGNPLSPGTSKLARAGKQSINVKIYKQYLNENDEVLYSIFMYDAKYRGMGAVYYENTAPVPLAAQ